MAISCCSCEQEGVYVIGEHLNGLSKPSYRAEIDISSRSGFKNPFLKLRSFPMDASHFIIA